MHINLGGRANNQFRGATALTSPLALTLIPPTWTPPPISITHLQRIRQLHLSGAWKITVATVQSFHFSQGVPCRSPFSWLPPARGPLSPGMGKRPCPSNSRPPPTLSQCRNSNFVSPVGLSLFLAFAENAGKSQSVARIRNGGGRNNIRWRF